MDPLEGETLTPGAEADHVVGPVMAEPPLVMVKSTCPVLLLQTPLTLILDLSHSGVAVNVGVKVGVTVAVFVAVKVAVKVAVVVAVLVGVFSGRREQEPTTLKVTEDKNEVRYVTVMVA